MLLIELTQYNSLTEEKILKILTWVVKKSWLNEAEREKGHIARFTIVKNSY